MSATIVFRGLMVFHKMGNVMDIGFLRAPGHVPRILTMKNGVLAGVFDLRRRPELDRETDWRLVVDNPLQPTAEPYRPGGAQFDRKTQTDLKDFRFIADFEAGDLHGRDLSNELITRPGPPPQGVRLILKVSNGLFYTRLLSPFLNRKRVHPLPEVVEPYGPAAAATGCDIMFNAGSVKLRAGGPTGAIAFDFNEGVESNTIYEISNSPPDVIPDPLNPPGHPPGHPPSHPPGGHFHMYYGLLFRPNPLQRFDLVPSDDPHPGPDPALCGVGGVGSRTIPLGTDPDE
ncbi:MAG: hypothetical protein WAQ99_05700 [Pyrinomonadaceae bacterium]